SDPGIAAVAGDRVFFPELPGGQSDPPAPAIVLSDAGGLNAIGGAYQDYGDARVDVRCYARTPNEARALHRRVHSALKHLRRYSAPTAKCFVHWARTAGGALDLRDPDTRWPFVLSTWQV